MRQIPLYIDSNKRYWYVTEEEICCDSCGEELFDIVFIRTQWSKQSQIGILCHKCTNNPFFNSPVEEWKTAKIVYKRKADFTPVLVLFPGMKATDRDLTVFDSEKINSPQVNDKTKYANRESWKDVQIGASMKDELRKLDKPLNTDEGLLLLDSLGKSELVLSESNIELLEEASKDE
ncbi:MAG: hypothetical protein ACP5N3_04115 [Candidatus Nanoarchaeia archaeon]